VTDEGAARARVVEIARSWLGTPFHHVAGKKGIGVDCAFLLARVYEEAGVIPPVQIERYSPQWFLHRDEERFIGYVLRCGGREIPEKDATTGDCALYKLGRCYAHGAIIVEWPREIIHAYLAVGFVTRYGGRDGELAGKPVKFFSLFPERRA
jgi:cell wall-associated NlpC family hydrolase